MVRVIVVNDFDLSSSIGLMFKDCEDAISDYGVLYTLIYSWKNVKYPGIPIYPDLFPNLQRKEILSALPWDFGIYLNSRASKLTFKKFIKRIVRERADEIIHYSNYRVSPFTQDYRSIITMNDLIYAKTRRPSEVLIKSFLLRNLSVYKKFEHVLSASEVVKSDLINYGFDGKITTIYQPVSKNFISLNMNKEKLRDKLGLPRNKYLLLSVSTNRPGKNLVALKELMNRLGNNYKLIRIGSPIGDSINFYGVNSETINEIYNACDVLVIPSTEEGFGRRVTEALTVGLPVVGSDIPVFREVAGEAANLVEPTPQKLMNAVVETVNDPSHYVTSGLKRSKMYSFSIYSEKLKNYYESVAHD